MPFVLFYPSICSKIILYSSGVDASRVTGAVVEALRRLGGGGMSTLIGSSKLHD